MSGRFDSAIDIPDIATPSTNPDAGRRKLYSKTDGRMYSLLPGGAETLHSQPGVRWNQNTAYLVGELVVYVGRLWRCVVANTGEAPSWFTGHWLPMTGMYVDAIPQTDPYFQSDSLTVGWETFWQSGTPTTALSTTAGDFENGVRGLKIAFISAGGLQRVYDKEEFQSRGGEIYEMEVRAKVTVPGSGAAAYLQAELWQSNGNSPEPFGTGQTIIGANEGNVPLTSNWETYKFTVQAVAGKDRARYNLNVFGAAGAASTVVIDKILYRKKLTANNTVTPDWRSVSMQASAMAIPNVTAPVIPFTVDKGGSGVTMDGSGRLVVNKPGTYHVIATCTTLASSATSTWVILSLIQRRGGTQITNRDVVITTASSGAFNNGVVQGDFDALPGDTFETTAQAQAAGITTIDGNRSHFTAHQIVGVAPSIVAAGFKSNATQSLANATATAVALQAVDHNVGGSISIASNVVTVGEAGIYELTASCTFDNVGSAGRRLLALETWTGADPGVSLATQLAREEITTAGVTQYFSPSLADQVLLAAGAKVRLYAYQISGGAINIGAIAPTRLTLQKVAGSSATPDTGWLRPGDLGGPTWGSGWTDYDTVNWEHIQVKRTGTKVQVTGVAKRTSGTGTTIIQLPVGMRPPRGVVRPGQRANNAFAECQVDSAGNVTLSVGTIASTSDPVCIEFEFDLAQV